MAWFYSVLLAAGSVGIVTYGVALTRRLFRLEVAGRDAAAPADGAGR